MQKYIITKADEGQTLIKYLQRLLPNASTSFFYKMLRKKNIVLNDNKKLDGKEKIFEGDELKLFLSDDTINLFSKSDTYDISEFEKAFHKLGKPQIVYEDEHVIIFNKPVGILAQKSKPDDLSANEWLIGYLLKENKINSNSLKSYKPSICNRLDRNTSGLMIFSKTLYGANTINPLIKSHMLEKYYVTLVYGNFNKEIHDVSYLKKNEKNNKVLISKESKKGFERIESYFNPIEYISKHNISLICVKLITGKTHQIRSSLENLGFPIVGERKYSSNNDNLLEQKFKLKHQILHAYKLVFPNMTNYKELSEKTFEINYPEIIYKLKE